MIHRTSASLWKTFCRFVEGKHVRAFGDLAAVVERCALFEFTDEQVEKAMAHRPSDLSRDEPYPIPPFPFPEMCIVCRSHIVVLQSPVMEDDGTLAFGMMLFYEDVTREPFFQMATCVVDSTRADEQGLFPMQLRDLRGILAGTPVEDGGPRSRAADDSRPGRATEIIQMMARANREIEKANARGDRAKAVEISRIRDDLAAVRRKVADMTDQKVAVEIERVQIEGELGSLSREHTALSFYAGLHHVNWINHPDHFTVSVEAPQVGKRKQMEKRLRRLSERPRHIVLTKSEIVQAWHRVHRGGTHASPIPHLRRGHYKTLRAERYQEKRGSRIWVRATQVNGACVQWRDGDIVYKVV